MCHERSKCVCYTLLSATVCCLHFVQFLNVFRVVVTKNYILCSIFERDIWTNEAIYFNFSKLRPYVNERIKEWYSCFEYKMECIKTEKVFHIKWCAMMLKSVEQKKNPENWNKTRKTEMNNKCHNIGTFNLHSRFCSQDAAASSRVRISLGIIMFILI